MSLSHRKVMASGDALIDLGNWNDSHNIAAISTAGNLDAGTSILGAVGASSLSSGGALTVGGVADFQSTTALNLTVRDTASPVYLLIDAQDSVMKGRLIQQGGNLVLTYNAYYGTDGSWYLDNVSQRATVIEMLPTNISAYSITAGANPRGSSNALRTNFAITEDGNVGINGNIQLPVYNDYAGVVNPDVEIKRDVAYSVLVQSLTGNTNTLFKVAPLGSALSPEIQVHRKSDTTTDAEYLRISSDLGEVGEFTIAPFLSGAGSNRPLVFRTGVPLTEAYRIDTTGTVTFTSGNTITLPGNQKITPTTAELLAIGASSLSTSGALDAGATTLGATQVTTLSALATDVDSLTVAGDTNLQTLTTTGATLGATGVTNLSSTGAAQVGSINVTGSGSIQNAYYIVQKPDVDQTSNGIVFSGVAGEALVAGDAVVLSSISQWLKVAASAEANANGLLGLTMETIAQSSSGNILLKGFYRDDSAYNFTPNSVLYLSLVAGALSTGQPSATGEIVRAAGYAYDADTVWFDPDNSYVEIA